MKRFILVLALVAVFVTPTFAQMRIDLGVVVPRGIGISGSGDVEGILSDYFIPFPEAGLYYQWDLGPMNLSAGGRFFTFILETVFWPNIMAEFELGPVFLDAQVGGLLFGMVGLLNDFSAGAVLVPDVSLWFGLGKKKVVRLGGGVMGLYAGEVADEMLMIYYFGGKVSLNP